MTVSADDIAVELGRTATSDAEFAQWGVWLEDAAMLIEARLGDLADLDEKRLDYVIRQAVAAHVRRPDDATTVAVSVDDGQSSRTYRTSAGRVTIRDEWWDLLSPQNGSRGAFSVTPSGGYTSHLPWCALMFAATYCSCGVDIAGEPIFEGSQWV